MRFLARSGLCLCSLALVALPVAYAQPPAYEGAGAQPAYSGQPVYNGQPVYSGQPMYNGQPVYNGQPAYNGQPVYSSQPAYNGQPANNGQAPAHRHKGLFAWRHCVECQRAYAKAHDGVDVPPPPSMMPPGTVPGMVAHQHNPSVSCPACQAGEVIVGPVTYVDQNTPGNAVMGGPAMASNLPPGYAVVGGAVPGMEGADPTPIGMARASAGQWGGPRMAAGPRMGSGAGYDPSVMPSSMIPAQTALDGATNDRPHVISHLFGFGGIARHRREAREDKDRQQHASISYDPPAKPVTEVPASLVYGKGH